MILKGTKSEKNVQAAFTGESQARNKYTYFAMQAYKEGHAEIGQMFEKMADNEREHAKLWFKLLHDGLGETGDNLRDSAVGENYEWKNMYPSFAEQAREDGLEMLAVMFERVAAIENDHEKRFLETYLHFQSSKAAKATDGGAATPTTPVATPTAQERKPYRCMFCGYMADNAMDVCPVCEAIGAFEPTR